MRRRARSLLDVHPGLRLARTGFPEPFRVNVERIKGQDDAFRLRQGDWRAMYRVDRIAGEMRVLVVEPRGRVYR